ncbi:hypothetical protein E2C01_086083 [Portunus trituberculatus]|uniref:Uncharacterized protein n=1 Tax=Portunus trituberculatus TaxID=210409 RepID=A0A5B7J2U2_PORTR|nr:hypothetical protein [Portunus trituberculatus]
MSLDISTKYDTEGSLATATKIKIAETFKIGISSKDVVASYNDWSTSFEAVS